MSSSVELRKSHHSLLDIPLESLQADGFTSWSGGCTEWPGHPAALQLVWPRYWPHTASPHPMWQPFHVKTPCLIHLHGSRYRTNRNMQNREKDTDVQNKLLDSVGEGEGGMFWKNSMYIIYSETDHQPRWDAWDKVLGPGALGRPRGIGWRGRWEGGSGWGIHVTPWLIHVNVWQNPLKCCEVISLQLIKINEKKKRPTGIVLTDIWGRQRENATGTLLRKSLLKLKSWDQSLI